MVAQTLTMINLKLGTYVSYVELHANYFKTTCIFTGVDAYIQTHNTAVN